MARAAGLVAGVLGVAIALVAGYLYLRYFGARPEDVVTYLAAGERLNAGHSLYALSPGDRPIPVNPPYWMAPLLSPPLIGVLWRPLAFGGLSMVYAWAIACGLILGATALVLLQRNPVVVGPLLLVLSPPLMYQAVSGNMNALLVAGSVLAWALWRRGLLDAAGVVTGVLVVAKLIPLPLALWLLAVCGRRALRGLALGGGGALFISVIGAGLGANLDYIGVIRSTALAGVSEFSIAGWAHDYLGVSTMVANLLPTITLAIGLGAVVLLRRRPGASYVAAALTMVLGFGSVHYHSFAMLLVAAAPAALPADSPGYPPATAVR